MKHTTMHTTTYNTFIHASNYNTIKVTKMLNNTRQLRFKVRDYKNQTAAKAKCIETRNMYERNGYNVAYVWSGLKQEYLLMVRPKLDMFNCGLVVDIAV